MNIPELTTPDISLKGDIFRYREESDTLLICFGDVMGKFVFKLTPFRQHTNALFIRNRVHIFYSGAFAFAKEKSFLDTVDILKEQIDIINPTKLILGGFSSGGFASLLFTPYLKPNHTIAFAPQTNLNKYSRSKANGWEKYRTVADNWDIEPPTTPIHVFRCDENTDRWFDKEESDHIKDFDNVKIHTVPGTTHGESFAYFARINYLDHMAYDPKIGIEQL